MISYKVCKVETPKKTDFYAFVNEEDIYESNKELSTFVKKLLKQFKPKYKFGQSVSFHTVDEGIKCGKINEITFVKKGKVKSVYYTIWDPELKIDYNHTPENKIICKCKKAKILDKCERRYLRSLLQPFKDKVISIEKEREVDNHHDSLPVYQRPIIRLRVRVEGEENILLPRFSIKSGQYSGMILDKSYSMKELGL